MKRYKLMTAGILACICAVLFSGCVTSSPRHLRSSVVEYLYPENELRTEKPSVPVLSLPLNVGIAFVPGTSGNQQSLTEREKMRLMKEVSGHFAGLDFVKSIELIPSDYLTPRGSFVNLDQLQTMFGIDVIALVSYDQTVFTDEGFASIAYWTLIGAYIVPGEKNDTHTMLDIAVYDIRSRKMLFRAPGTSHIRSTATPVNVSEQTRLDSIAGFHEASRELAASLEYQLDLFKQKVRASPEDYRVVHKAGYTGGGSMDLIFSGAVFLFGGFYLLRAGGLRV